ncbi:MAG: HAD family hydrolase [Thaumarchaeota archaeon]|jgi:FMN phosphatase YigB (HAD superfamily)|nr:HAD family hydrolase [Nitrososphaerota archaeon]
MHKSTRVVSLDFSGTLVTEDYLEYFWKEVIPKAYSIKEGISLKEAKSKVFEEYGKVSKDDINWYLPNYWLNKLGINNSLSELVAQSLVALRFYEDALSFIEKVKNKYTLIVASGVSSSLMLPALSTLKFKFYRVYSSTDMFFVGKPPSFYNFILEDLKILPSQIIHVGDDKLNDVENPMKVGIRSYLIDRKNNVDFYSLLRLLK